MSGRSDASTSTDDVQARPLCLFYFTHPFGVLSPEPPTALGAAPAHVARAFLNMEPVAPFYWRTAAHAPPPAAPAARSAATGDSLELGTAAVHARPLPVRVLSVRPRSLSSSLLSGELWFESSCSSRADPPRRAPPYTRILPPLRLPSARALADRAEDDVWPRRCRHPEKFSLPPIELPAAARAPSPYYFAGAGAGREPRARRRLGVDKQRRRRRARAAAADVRRALACLVRRAVAGGGAGAESSPSPALQRALAVIRDAWAEPATLRERCGILSRTIDRCTMEGRTPVRQPRSPPGPVARVHASPGLLRRRYSVPETIMRKYRLAQQHSDSEESAAARGSAPSAGPSPARSPGASPARSPGASPARSPGDSPHRLLRRDRELMRKSALLRRLWARPCACCEEARGTRSLDGSRSELSRRSPAPRAPWASPKRQRLEPPIAGADLSDSTFRSHLAGRELSSRADTADALTDSELPPAASPPSSPRLVAGLERSDRLPPSSNACEGHSYFGSDAYGGHSCLVSDARDAHSHLDSEACVTGSYPDSDVRVAGSFLDAHARDTGSCLGSDVRAADSYLKSSTLSTSVSPAKETSDSPPRDSVSSRGRIEGHVSERSAGADNEEPYERAPHYERLETRAPLYELLEIVVSESADASNAHDVTAPSTVAALSLSDARDIDIDEYVSNILVESLNSLTDQLETMNATIGNSRRINIVEKEIKVRLQNTGVNTIVHLSPTSNNQIIFGNEELCNEPRDECNNPLAIREERARELGSNGNLTSSAGSGAPSLPVLALDPPPRDGVNRAVLQQIQRLFRDELRSLEESPGGGVSHVDVSSVDAYMAAHGAEDAPRLELAVAARADGVLIADVGAGNYFRGDETAAVPRFSAFPHTESMEVNTSSSSEGEAACSECASLVDSLEDPNSPRAVSLRRRSRLARSAVDVLELLPERAREPSADSRGEAFFVPIEDDDLERSEPDRLEGAVRVAEYMPEKIKQRLYRRHHKRELRMECARRSKVKQLKRELERHRVEEAAAARRELERDCLAIVHALIDDVVARIAQDEYKYMRIKCRNGELPASRSDGHLARRVGRRDFEPRSEGVDSSAANARRSANKENRKSGRHHIHGKLLARPSLANPDRPPRRIYQKSEIHEGEKCIEILEILEYVNGSQSSPEATNSDENHNSNSRCKKSRIPIPVYERIQKTFHGEGRMRLTDGASPPVTGRALAGALLQAFGEAPPSPRALLHALGEVPPSPAAPAPPEPRSRSNSLRFKRVFDIIPEERSSLSLESSPEDARCGSAPEAAPPGGARRDTRSAGTSPPERRARGLRSQTTMTSPCTKSAATSPLRPPALPEPLAPPRPAREGRGREKPAEKEKVSPPPPTEGECLAERGPRAERAGRAVPCERAGGAAPCERAGGAARCERAGEVARGGARDRRRAASSSSDSGDSGGSLLCSLAPRWLSAHARQRRRTRRPPPAAPHAAPSAAPHAATHAHVHSPCTDASPEGTGTSAARAPAADAAGARGWSVTVAGSCRAALPADVEMRLRFPGEPPPLPPPRAAPERALSAATYQECACVQCARCAGARALPGAGAADPRLTLTMKKEAQAWSLSQTNDVYGGPPSLTPSLSHEARRESAREGAARVESRLRLVADSSLLATKSVRKSSAQLPELETYRASRTKTKSSVKTRRGYSLHCWLPADEPAPIRANNGLSVLGCAIIPELKPRVPTMSERDLTRVYTPRHYLRS